MVLSIRHGSEGVGVVFLFGRKSVRRTCVINKAKKIFAMR